VLDMAVSQMAGFGFDAESVGKRLLDGGAARPDPAATQPDDWDEAEDGPWEAPMLPAKDAIALLAEVVKAEGEEASAIGDAYSFSSSAQVVRYRAGTRGREAPEHHCNDFGRQDREMPHVAFLAELYTSAGGSGGGETTFPALGLSVAPKPGRLVLYETILPDGSCDPAASLVGRAPLAASASDVTVLRKRFYADRSFSRANVNHEGPQRGTPIAKCEASPLEGGGGGGKNGKKAAGGAGAAPGELAICTRHEHVPAEKGDAVLPLREVATRRKCLPPNASGPCPAEEGYVPPPPPPRKQRKPPPSPAPSTPPPEGPSAPPPPTQPGAPPPIVR
jgi:hypothetical protein